MIVRALLVLTVGGFALGVRLALFRRRRWRGTDPLPGARFPGWVTDGAARTWVIFTTPYCASCGPVVDHLQNVDPAARVVEVDAGRHHGLARDFAVRRAPTTFEADERGVPRRRFVGPEDVLATVG